MNSLWHGLISYLNELRLQMVKHNVVRYEVNFRLWEEEVKFHAFLTRHALEMSGKLHAPEPSGRGPNGMLCVGGWKEGAF